MPQPYLQSHWEFFSSTKYQRQGPTGNIPSDWANRFGLEVPGIRELPRQQLDRVQVRAISINPENHVLFGYACAMAWGGQGSGVTKQFVRWAWEHRDKLESHLTRLREGDLTRRASYDLFCGSGTIRGLGPSFFTKLLYFFTPETNCYIMDQWTAKSINLLTGRSVVQVTGDAPPRENTGANYQAFCEEVDAISKVIGCTGQEAEERFFSQGGRRPWPWREYVKKNWKAGGLEPSKSVITPR